MEKKSPPPSRQARFEDLYRRFNRAERLGGDPLGEIDRALPPRDFEILSFIVAGLSYGRVAQIQSSARLLRMRLAGLGIQANGEGLADHLRQTPEDVLRGQLRENLGDWAHRMNTSSDLVAIFLALARCLREHGSLCATFQASFDEDPKLHLVNFCAAVAGYPSPRKSGQDGWAGTGASWFASSPASGSTCKRLMMWLRWMIRKDEIDPGTWREPALLNPSRPAPSPARLFYPVDTHIFTWARRNRILRTQSPTWKSVESLTKYFRKICPEDPVKYDFGICHLGMKSDEPAAQK